jgi:type 1 glutamine amidotransferase
MKRRDFILASGAAMGLTALPLGWTIAKDAPRRRVLMFTRSAGFQHSVITRRADQLGHAERIASDLGRQNNIEVVVTKDGSVFDSDLDQFDAFFFYTTGDLTSEKSADKSPPMSADGKKRFLDAIAAGKGFVGLHCASDTFHSAGPARENQQQPDPYIAMLGGEFISHGRQQSAKQKVVDSKFPGVESLGEAFTVEEEWYALKNFAPDLHVVLVMETAGMEGRDYQRPPFPCTWARKHNNGRVFYTSMGHREDVWTNPKFQSVLVGGLQWAVGNVEAEVTPNISDVAPQASNLG